MRRFTSFLFANKLVRSEGGFVLMLTALVILPVMAMVGLCFDAGRGFMAREALSHASRAAALFGTQRLDAAPEPAVTAMVELNAPGARVTTSVDVPTSSVAVVAQATSIPIIMTVFGSDDITITARTRARRTGTELPYEHQLY